MRYLSAGATEKLAWAGVKISLIEIGSVDFRTKLARPELKWAELMTTLYSVNHNSPKVLFGENHSLAGNQKTRN